MYIILGVYTMIYCTLLVVSDIWWNMSNITSYYTYVLTMLKSNSPTWTHRYWSSPLCYEYREFFEEEHGGGLEIGVTSIGNRIEDDDCQSKRTKTLPW